MSRKQEIHDHIESNTEQKSQRVTTENLSSRTKITLT